jgi:predicted sulfurtransferase
MSKICFEQHTARSLCFRQCPQQGTDTTTITTTSTTTTTDSIQQLVIAIEGKESNSKATFDIVSEYYNNRPSRQSLNGKVLLFYKYCDISEPQKLLSWQKTLCGLLRLRGRIHVGKEGLNGTVGGSIKATELYIKALQSHNQWSKYFADTEFKTSLGGHHCFPNLFVRVCSEICQMNASPEQIQWKDGGQHLQANDFHRLVEEMNRKDELKDSRGEHDTVLLDVRNMYESAVGQFDGAIRVPTRHFTDFPKVADEMIKQYDLKSKKRVLMYCTGGIRCERASAYLRSKGVKQCYQLKGGIHKYCEEMGRKTLFRGKNFVFDRRLTTARVGTEVPLSKCITCNELCDEYDKNFSCGVCSSLVLLCKPCRCLVKSNTIDAKKLKCTSCVALCENMKK